jgi:hypothetical protein
MSKLQDNFFFVIYPKTIILKDSRNAPKLPYYSVGIFKGYYSSMQEILGKIVQLLFPPKNSNFTKHYISYKNVNSNLIKL